jgi:hypothetical protein
MDSDGLDIPHYLLRSPQPALPATLQEGEPDGCVTLHRRPSWGRGTPHARVPRIVFWAGADHRDAIPRVCTS